MKSSGEIEAALCQSLSGFAREYMGHAPREVRTRLIGDLAVVRLFDVLTSAEKQLIKKLPAERGRDLLKQVRNQLLESARPIMEAIVEEITGVKILSLHHDISTVTGEEVIIFSLVQAPHCRVYKK